MSQGELIFDLDAGKRLKADGLDLVSSHNERFVDLMRREARRLAWANGQVSCDELRRYAALHGIEPRHPNAWGLSFERLNGCWFPAASPRSNPTMPEKSKSGGCHDQIQNRPRSF